MAGYENGGCDGGVELTRSDFVFENDIISTTSASRGGGAAKYEKER